MGISVNFPQTSLTMQEYTTGKTRACCHSSVIHWQSCNCHMHSTDSSEWHLYMIQPMPVLWAQQQTSYCCSS